MRVNENTAPEPLLADAKAVAALLGLCVRSVRSMDASGKLPQPLRIGGRVLWRVSELHQWIEAGAPDRKTWNALRRRR